MRYKINETIITASNSTKAIKAYKIFKDSKFRDVDIEEELEKYKKSGKFNAKQMEQIREGLKSHVNVSKYADPKFDDRQMREIRYGLENHVDVSKYADPKFHDWAEMWQIREGLENHVDVSKYADPKYTWPEMEKIRKQLEKGIYNEELEKYKKTNRFNKGQLSIIKEGLENHLDVSKYADPKFNSDQMWQIKLGLEEHLDVSKYADPKYTWSQMREIRRQLQNGTYKDSIRDVDLDKYQEWVDYDMKHYGHISDKTNRLVKEAGLEIVKDIYGDYEVIAYEDNGYRKDSKFKDKRYDVNLIKQDLENGINKYFTNDKEMLDYTDVRVKEDSDKITIEVGAELYYGQMEKLAKYLDRIIKDYDRNAYFEHDDPGLISAFIRKK